MTFATLRASSPHRLVGLRREVLGGPLRDDLERGEDVHRSRALELEPTPHPGDRTPAHEQTEGRKKNLEAAGIVVHHLQGGSPQRCIGRAMTAAWRGP